MKRIKSAPKLSMLKLSLNDKLAPKKSHLLDEKSKLASKNNRFEFLLLSTNKKTRKQNLNYLKTEYISKFKLIHPLNLNSAQNNIKISKSCSNTDEKSNIENDNPIENIKKESYKTFSSRIIPKKFCFDDIEIKNHPKYDLTKETKITDYFFKKKNIIIPQIKKFEELEEVAEKS